MSKITVKTEDAGRCLIRDERSGARIITDLPLEYGGKGSSFSSTDLVAGAVGSCILSSISPILDREGYDTGLAEVSIIKKMSISPRMIASIAVEVYHPEPFEDLMLKKLQRAVAACPVKRSLNEKIEISVIFGYRKNG